MISYNDRRGNDLNRQCFIHIYIYICIVMCTTLKLQKFNAQGFRANRQLKHSVTVPISNSLHIVLYSMH